MFKEGDKVIVTKRSSPDYRSEKMIGKEFIIKELYPSTRGERVNLNIKDSELGPENWHNSDGGYYIDASCVELVGSSYPIF